MIVNQLGARGRSNLGVQTQNMKWRQFNLSEATDAMSSTGLESATQDMSTGVITVELSMETASRKVGSGYQLGYQLPVAWKWSELQWAAVSIEKVGAGVNLGASAMYVFAGLGLTTAAGFNTCAAVGFQQDSGTATSLDVGVILAQSDTVNPSYSGAQTNVKGVVGEFAIGPGARLLNCTATAVTGYDPEVWKYTKRATGTIAITAADDVFGMFFACGIDTATGETDETSTLSFRAHYMLSGRNKDWFQNNDG
jgi:hypothetical protein